MKSLIILLAGVIFQIGCASHQSSIIQHSSIEKRATFSVSSSEPLVSEVAAKIFRAGGNIADAAVAASFAVSVVRPQSTGIGGGGFLVFHSVKAKKTRAYDFREIAPLEAEDDMFLDENDKVIPDLSTTGAKAVGVPGIVAGLYDFHKKFGKLPWATVVQPSIALAESKIPVSRHMATHLKDEADELLKDSEMKSLFFLGDRPLNEGEFFTNLNLAKTLKQIARFGKKYFYEGEFANKLAAFMKQRGGIITEEDLNRYEVKERSPLRANWRGYKLISFPPPSSGGVHLLQILKIFDQIPEAYKLAHGKRVAEIESMKRAFIDRSFLLGDPSFTRVPVNSLLSDSYLKKRADEISKGDVVPSADILPWAREKTNHETTHISLMDGDGNAISTTQSVNGYFGAKIVVPGTGVILNNTMDDFSIQPAVANQFGLVGGRSNRIQPAKRPLSSMTPTIVLDSNGATLLAIGAPGGSRIITGVYHVLSRILREHQSPAEAISACRFHHQWMPDKVLVEPECLRSFKPLEKIYKVEKASPFGEIQIVGKNSSGELYSVVDPRGQAQPLVGN